VTNPLSPFIDIHCLTVGVVLREYRGKTVPFRRAGSKTIKHSIF
jgi:hypothetical protein